MSSESARRPARVRAEARLARRGGGVELLRIPAALFGAAARVRAALYDRGLLRILELDPPVISVGNLTAGGTGKTPMVAWIVRRLQGRGRRPGILSRGYRAEQGGPNDEARLLERLFPDVPHVQDPDRVAGGSELCRRGVDVVVLDDGFQHRRLHRDLDLVLVDSTRPWGLGPPAEGGPPVRALLPRGLLRERPAALARAHAIVLTRTDQAERAAVEALARELEALVPGVPIARAEHRPARLAGPDGEVELGFLAGREVDLVSGIGNPEAFEATVRALGAGIAGHRAFPDHHAFGATDLDGLGSRPVVTTAKDAVRLEPGDLPVYVLDVELAIVEGEAVLDALLDALPESAASLERRAIHEGLHG